MCYVLWSRWSPMLSAFFPSFSPFFLFILLSDSCFLIYVSVYSTWCVCTCVLVWLYVPIWNLEFTNERKMFGNCFSESGLICLTEWPQVGSIFRQMMQFYSSLLLNKKFLVWIDHLLFIYPSTVECHLGWLHYLSTVNQHACAVFSVVCWIQCDQQ